MLKRTRNLARVIRNLLLFACSLSPYVLLRPERNVFVPSTNIASQRDIDWFYRPVWRRDGLNASPKFGCKGSLDLAVTTETKHPLHDFHALKLLPVFHSL